MKVYLLEFHVDYEGSGVKGVFLRREDAIASIPETYRTRPGWRVRDMFYDVSEVEVMEMPTDVA